MRLFKRGRAIVLYQGEKFPCALRPIKGQFQVMRHGEYVQDVLRLLLPWKMKIQPGDRVEVEEASYLCLSVRWFPGHIQADVRRCCR